MKIVVTVTSVADVVYAGGSPESRSAIIELNDNQVPEIVKKYFANREWASKDKNRYTYESMTFSILEEK